MTFQHMKLGVAAGWMLTVGAVALGSGVTGTVPALWVAAAALIPASLGMLLWQPAARTVTQIIHDTDLAP